MTDAPLFVRLDAADNVVTATRALEAGTPVEEAKTTTLIPSGHKIATRPIARGEPILKYNTVIGFAGEDLEPGRAHIESLERSRALAQCADVALRRDGADVVHERQHPRGLQLRIEQRERWLVQKAEREARRLRQGLLSQPTTRLTNEPRTPSRCGAVFLNSTD